MQYRRAQPDDHNAIAAFVIEGMRAEKYPSIVSRPKINALIRTIVSSPEHFHLLAFTDDGELVGVVAVLVVESLLFERCEAHVVACRATQPGAGHALMTALRDWRRSDMRIGRTIWMMEIDGNPLIERFARWYGFRHDTTTMIAFRGN